MRTFITQNFYTQRKREEEKIERMVAALREHMTPEEKREREKQRQEALARMLERQQREKTRFVGNRAKRKAFFQCVKRALRVAEESMMNVRVSFGERWGVIVFETDALFFDGDCGNLREGRAFFALLQEADECWMSVEQTAGDPLIRIRLKFSLADAYPLKA